MKRLSYSKLDTFKQCPLKFKKLYIEKAPKVDSLALRYGSFVHNILEEMGKTLKYTNSVYPDNMNDVVLDAWKKYKKMYGLERDKDLLMEANGIVHQMAKMYKGLSDYEIIFNEKAFNLPVGKFSVQGKVDQVIRIKDIIYVKDYKTNKDDKYLIKDPLQLAIYAMAAESEFRFPIEKTKCTFVFLRLGCKESPITFSKKNLEETHDTVHALGSEIERCEELDEFRPVTGPLCPWCQMFDSCKAAQAKPNLMKKHAELQAQGKVA